METKRMQIEQKQYCLYLNDPTILTTINKKLIEGYTEIAIAYTENIIENVDFGQKNNFYIFCHPNQSKDIYEFLREGEGIGHLFPLINQKFSKEDFDKYCAEKKIKIGMMDELKQFLDELLRNY